MRRRSFLAAAAGASAASALARPAIAQSTPAVTWRLQSSYPKSLTVVYGAAEVFAKAVSDATDGKFRINVFAAGEIAPPNAVLDAVQAGTVEMGHTGSTFYVGKDMAFAFGSTIPFGMNQRQHTAWLQHGGGEELLSAFYKTHNVAWTPIGDTGTQMGGWFRREIKSAADFRGLKFRISGISGFILQRIGVIAQTIPPGDIYPALERGTIDAAELVGPADDEKIGLYRVAPYYYYPGFWEGASTLALFTNLQKWEELPAAYKTIVKHAATYAGLDMTARYDSENPKALARLVSAGAQVRAFPTDLIQASFTAANEFYAETARANPTFKAMLESMQAFQRANASWWAISEHTYDAVMINLLRQNRGK